MAYDGVDDDDDDASTVHLSDEASESSCYVDADYDYGDHSSPFLPWLMNYYCAWLCCYYPASFGANHSYSVLRNHYKTPTILSLHFPDLIRCESSHALPNDPTS